MFAKGLRSVRPLPGLALARPRLHALASARVCIRTHLCPCVFTLVPVCVHTCSPHVCVHICARVCSFTLVLRRPCVYVRTHLCPCVFTLVLRPRVCSHLCTCAFTLVLRPCEHTKGRSKSVNAHVHKCERTHAGRSTSVNTHGHKCVRTHTGAEHKCERTRAQM